MEICPLCHKVLHHEDCPTRRPPPDLGEAIGRAVRDALEKRILSLPPPDLNLDAPHTLPSGRQIDLPLKPVQPR